MGTVPRRSKMLQFDIRAWSPTHRVVRSSQSSSSLDVWREQRTLCSEEDPPCISITSLCSLQLQFAMLSSGNFSGTRQQEIIVSRGTRLELLRPDTQTGKISTVLANDVFGSIRSLAAFRLTGGTKGALPVRIPVPYCC